jgi:putative membrane protein
MHINAIVGSISDPVAVVSAYSAFVLFSFIPPVYLYSMNTDVGAAMLPSQRMALQGRGGEAVLLSVSGAMLAFLLFAPLLLSGLVDPLFIFFSSEYVALSVVLLTIAVLFAQQKKRLPALFIFLLTGLLGIFSMRLPNALMPMLSGFFGLPALLQRGSEIEIPQSEEGESRRALPFLISSLLGLLSASVKAVTPGTISVLLYVGLRTDRERMLSMGALAGANAIVTIGNFYATGSLRSGPAVQLARIGLSIPQSTALFAFLLSALLSCAVLLAVSGTLNRMYHAINRWRVIFVALLLMLILTFSGIGGILLFVVSSTIGVLTVRLKIRRINCMGCIVIPSLVGFLW